MRLVLASLALLSVATLPLTAHADTIDNFVLTGNGHTITWSLPALETFVSMRPIRQVSFPTTITVDGGAPESSDITFITSGFATMFDPIPPFHDLLGVDVVDLTFGPPGDFTVEATFSTGTFDLVDTNPPTGPWVDYTLTITQAATTPEPSSLALLATAGLLLLLGLKRPALSQNPATP